MVPLHNAAYSPKYHSKPPSYWLLLGNSRHRYFGSIATADYYSLITIPVAFSARATGSAPACCSAPARAPSSCCCGRTAPAPRRSSGACQPPDAPFSAPAPAFACAGACACACARCRISQPRLPQTELGWFRLSTRIKANERIRRRISRPAI